MGLLKKLVIGLAVIVGLFLGIGFFLSSEFHVERSIQINAPVDKVFSNIVNLKKWREWGIWFERDPNMQVTYTGPDSDVGMKSSWISEQEGSGEMQIIGLEPNSNVKYSLYFPDFDMGSTGELQLTQEGEMTKVVWMDYGDVGSNPVNHYFALMMDGMIGPDFEAGLQNLKELSESN